ncbi:MAG TPA: hypothetical protein VFH27_11125, partial [Longimicrobiaceae bacterium]|nr:hypothetical protein [Longimicrobiaceae bacterium]
MLWAPALIAVLVLGSAPFAVHPLVDAVTLGPTTGAELRRSGAYLALAPFSDLADAISLLTVRQHIALLVTILALFAVWRIARRGRTASATVARRVGREVLGLVGVFAAVLAFYAAAILLPRPMAALALGDADELAVEFHAHTEFSHDGRAGLTPERVRQWHAASGFHAAYITDHRTLRGAAGGLRGNPARAGDGTSLFSGIELISGKLHLN